jgi:hypothetical protein
MEPQLPLSARTELDAALWRAADRVKIWPAQDLFARYGVGPGKDIKVAPVMAPLKTGDAGKLDDRPRAARN